jgi:hypothetical protein
LLGFVVVGGDGDGEGGAALGAVGQEGLQRAALELLHDVAPAAVAARQKKKKEKKIYRVYNL